MFGWRYGWPTEDINREAALKMWPEIAADTLLGYIRYVKNLAGENRRGAFEKLKALAPKARAFAERNPEYAEKIREAMTLQ